MGKLYKIKAYSNGKCKGYVKKVSEIQSSFELSKDKFKGYTSEVAVHTDIDKLMRICNLLGKDYTFIYE